ncbi:late endosomal/lysosomal adaptor and MAPK and MTOR activator-domain-containing protein [Aspergillus ambiguus]|uniref:LAMTOR1/MEH1 family protein n=1 Tax=Aspergillus ambiguus TaxID=176160 RepID=UPI003CCD6E93
MGVCASCLGQSRHESPEPESSRLLEEDPYQAGYGYGALNHANQVNQPDSGYIRREREALEAICQRTSESVIDIWSLQPQPHLQPQATLRGPVSPSTSRPESHDGTSVRVATTTTTSDVAEPTRQSTGGTGGAVPKHWGEVVINPRKGKKAGAQETNAGENGRDFFGVLQLT